MTVKDNSTVRLLSSPPRSVGARLNPALCLLVGAALWVASAVGLDPTNVPQAQDFERFHFPSIRLFAAKPFADAIADYPAAPFPLFYVLGGWLYKATGSVSVLRAWTIGLALGILLLVHGLARRLTPHHRECALLAVAVTLVSPYFRGQSVYANTDILALLFALAALYLISGPAVPFPTRRAAGALVLACGAVYTRQFYVFMPAYVLLRICADTPWKGRLGAVALCGALAAPALALVSFWHGVTPPGFREHAIMPSLTRSVPAVVLLLSFYAIPLALVTAWKYRDAFTLALRSRRLQALMAPFIALAVYFLLAGVAAIPEVTGGGMPLHFLRALPLPNHGRALLLALGVALGGSYLAYLVSQNPARNSVVLLVAVCFLPTGILYQRYFDPLMPLLYTSVISTREVSPLTASTAFSLTIVFEFAIAVIAAAHYLTVFGSPSL